MQNKTSHRQALFLMVCATLLWSSAGVITRQLDSARDFEVTFWRSLFAALFVAATLLWQHQSHAVNKMKAVGRIGFISGLMWSVMFSCFMIALTMTSVANTLIVISISPLLTAVFSKIFLQQRITLRTWCAIAVAMLGMVWMFVDGFSSMDARGLTGMLVAMGVPIAASVNVICMKKSGDEHSKLLQPGRSIDLIPSVLIGGVISAIAMLPMALPFQANIHDLIILALLGFFQLGLPCMLLVRAARTLTATAVSLLSLLEVLLGPIWAWLWANEVPTQTTLIGGGIVLAALIYNEFSAMRNRQ